MATFLDVTLLGKFSIIFPFLLAFVVVFAVMSTTKIFGTNRALHAFFAFVVAVFTFFSPTIRIIINKMAPWFIILFIAIVFIIMTFKAYGATDADIIGVIRSERWGNQIFWWAMILVLIIVIGSITSTTLKSTDEGYRPDVNITTVEGAAAGGVQEKSTFWETLLHPKVLGLIAILMIANFTISKLASMR